MKTPSHIVLRASAKLFTPVIALFALSLLAMRGPGEGVGLLAGLAVSMAPVLHTIVFGAAATRAAIPGLFLRAALAFGLIASVAAAGLPGWSFAAHAGEAGLFLTTSSAVCLALAALAGRAPTLRDEDW